MIKEQLQKQTSAMPSILLLVAFIAELLTPILIWKGVLPGIFRWIADGAIALMIILVPLRMLAFRRFPPVFWVILLLSLVGILTSTLSGQGIPATAWGWWLMFQFPMVGLFAYLQPAWPKNFTRSLLSALVIIAGFEVLVQVGQYFTGEIPGDNLAGTFGQNGTGDLVLFLIIALSFSLGDWLVNQNWINLILVLGLGLISSILGEMKLFYIAILILGALALIFFIFRGRQVWKLIPITFFLALSLLAFFPLYNTVVPSAGQYPIERYIQNPTFITKYLTFVNQTTAGSNYYFDVGRNYAIEYGWDKINNRPEYLYLGYGLGARSESRTLGIIGRGIAEGDLGITSGTSLLVMLQETGLLGLIGLGGFFLIVIFHLAGEIRKDPEGESNGLRYGLVFFTLLWPVWLWYNAAWTLRIPMLIYWSTLGYVIGQSYRSTVQIPIRQSIQRITLNRFSDRSEGDLV